MESDRRQGEEHTGYKVEITDVQPNQLQDRSGTLTVPLPRPGRNQRGGSAGYRTEGGLEEDSRPSFNHILWDCEGLKTYRCLIFSKMEQIDRPSNLRDWTHPAGDSQRKTRVLRSLLEYISTGGLTSCI
ncbi:hypothetical protein HPB47_000900 [Ixodes persulcatus]|uniref:Uncharacterized protein n=1 Tax=Ixodes persulcatus TaxID=34615 RepID=A0AC60PS09_IXOPE|nr:hypothetical protein HPB47_000900 [Ixodes persulcatus]